MLVLWTGADVKAFKEVVGPVVKAYDIEHKVVKVDEKSKTLPELKPGDVCLAFGFKALEVVKAAGLVQKNRKLGSLRNQEMSVNGASMLFTFDPGAVYKDYARKADIQWDTNLAIRRAVTGTLEPKTGKYRWVDSFKDAIDFIKAEYAKTGKPVQLSCDLETVGLYPYNPDVWIVSISFTYKAGTADAMYFDGLKDQLSPGCCPAWEEINWLLNTPMAKTVGANFKFDCSWMREKWKIECTNFKFDTLLSGSLVDENRTNSLNMHAKVYTTMGGYDDKFNAKYDKSQMHLVPRSDLLQYAGGDTDACYRSADVIRRELIKDKALTNFYVKLLHPASRAFEKLEARGIVLDTKVYAELRTHVASDIERLKNEAFAMMPRRIRLKYSDNLSLTRDVILREFLFTPRGLNLKPLMFTEKEGDPSTAMEHLDMFAEVPEAKAFVGILKEHNVATKTLSTYIDGFLEHLRSDGRLHPSYMLHKGEYDNKDSGTNTGRTSAKDPAWQTLPKKTRWAKALRAAYTAPPGMVVLNCDYSQGELRLAACVANERRMLEAYKSDFDLHAITAAKLVGLPLEEFMALPEEERDKYRSGGKAGNFGLLYGMSAGGFMDYARKSYGVILTLDQCETFREGFFELYADLVTWHETYKAIAHKQGFVRSPLGRVRHLPLINTFNNEVRAKQERQAVNSPIQGALSDMAMLAMVHLDRQYPELQIIGMTHDSLTMYVPEDQAEVWAVRVKEVMENLPLAKDFGWTPQLVFKADAEIGKNMAEMKKFKQAA